MQSEKFVQLEEERSSRNECRRLLLSAGADPTTRADVDYIPTALLTAVGGGTVVSLSLLRF